MIISTYTFSFSSFALQFYIFFLRLFQASLFMNEFVSLMVYVSSINPFTIFLNSLSTSIYLNYGLMYFLLSCFKMKNHFFKYIITNYLNKKLNIKGFVYEYVSFCYYFSLILLFLSTIISVHQITFSN